ncbi:hypothetical protein BN873_1060001 [Candidatus Competibacter denitrificans Run_A_D11]|uniref:Uncharacterized protein n=1 Tax=Candidatus Competibacter denitrificans Run_A_D11 TaxID=1400863 RepID=W6M183_9GAMM|nr:hypothetical protein BN873_1060001 [Candidatus Competibacter denitrificans Run_A_D11]
MLNGVVIVNAPDTSVSSFPTVEHLHNQIYSLSATAILPPRWIGFTASSRPLVLMRCGSLISRTS